MSNSADFFKQYPAGTTGSFTVGEGGAVGLEVKLPPQAYSAPEEMTGPQTYRVKIDSDDRNRAKRCLAACDTTLGWHDGDEYLYFTSTNPNLDSFDASTIEKISVAEYATAYTSAIGKGKWVATQGKNLPENL